MNTPNTLTTTANGQQRGGSLTVYQQFKDPLEAIDKLGEWFQQSGMLAKNPGQARILALACIVRGEDPLKLLAENMIVDGKLTRKYQMLLVDLRTAGGNYRWIDTGEDGQQATIEIEWRGEKNRYTFTMEMARRAGYIKANGPWEKLPGNMLRSKAVRQSFDLFCPEVSAGYLTPEDVLDYQEEEPKPEPKKRGKAAIKEHDLPVANPETSAAVVQAESPPFETETVEAEYTVNKTGTEQDQNSTAAASAPVGVTREQMKELVDKCKALGLEGPTIKKHICDSAGVDDLSKVTFDQWREMLAKVEAKLEARTVSVGN